MTSAIIVALITASASVLCQLIISANSRKSVQITQHENQKLLEYKIDKLSERVDKHNNLIERTFKLEEKSELLDEKIKVANHRIDDLERK